MINNIENNGAYSFSDIWSKLRRPSNGLIIFLIGMNMQYILPLLIPNSRVEGAALGTYRYIFIFKLLIIIGAYIETKKTKFLLLRKYPYWTALGIFSLVIMTYLLYRQGNTVLQIYEALHPFVWVFLVPSFMIASRNMYWLIITFMLHATISIVYMLNIVFFQELLSRNALLNVEQFTFFISCGYMSIFILFLLPKLSGILFPSIAIMMYIVLSFVLYLSAFRYAILLIPVQLLLLVIFAYRTGLSGKLMRISFKLLFIIFVLTVVVSTLFIMDINSEAQYYIDIAANNFNDRMKKNLFSTIIENERVDEIKGALTLMSLESWVLGKGPYSNEIAHGMILYGAIHNSYINLFLWGGILLFLFIMNPLLWVLKALLYNKNIITLASAGYIFICYLRFPAAIVYSSNLEWLLFCLLIGRCAVSESVFSENHSVQLLKK